MEDGNLRLSTRFPEHHPLTSSQANQRKVTHPNYTYKNFSLKSIGEFGVWGYKPPIPLTWPCNNISVLQKKLMMMMTIIKAKVIFFLICQVAYGILAS